MDKQYMQRAIELAEKGRGRTSPNPMVGAVIVKDGRIVGEGFHQEAGQAHAEINALGQAGKRSNEAAMYVTVEPCCFQGRTPPCTAAIKRAGIKEVIVGMEDPNPRVAGKGIRELEWQGIRARSGFLAGQIAAQNEIYIKHITTRLPFVLMKAGMSLDGKLAAHRDECTVISSEKSREAVHVLRDQYDSIVVGIGTVLTDDPLLTTRLDGRESKNPIRVVVDSSLRIPVESKIVATASDVETIIVYARGEEAKKKVLAEKGAELLAMPGANGRVDLFALIKELGSRGISCVLWEGGSKLNAAALKAGIVDKVQLYIAPVLIGDAHAPGLVENGVGKEGTTKCFRISNTWLSGDDLAVEAYPVERKEDPGSMANKHARNHVHGHH